MYGPGPLRGCRGWDAERLGALIRDASLYHVSPLPDGVHWGGIEYWDDSRGSGVVFAFRGTIENEDNHSFVLKGLDASRRYRLHFNDRSSADRVAAGAD